MVSQRQRIGGYAVCVDDGQVLLCRMSARTKSPGTWTLPGGGVHHGEHPEAAVLRELAEETGLTGSIDGLVGVHSGVYRSDDAHIHGVYLLYRVRITGGDLRAEPDGSTDHARWFTPDALDAVTLSGHARAGLDLSGSRG